MRPTALSGGAARVIAVERDARCLDALSDISARWPGRLEVIEGDALAVDLGPALARAPGRPRICANLPYNVGTELLVRWLTPPGWPPWWESLTLMFQREVAERIVAEPGGKAFGRLAVLAQWRAAARICFQVHPSAFTPPPSVTSAVVHLRPAEAPADVDPKILERVTAAAFAQRRKMLRQSLKGLGGDPAALLDAAGIDGTRRAESLSIAEFLALARAEAARRG